MQNKQKNSTLISWLIAVLVFFISIIRVYDIGLDKITPGSAFSPFIPTVVVPAYIFFFIRSRKGSLRAQLVLLNFLFFYIYLSFLNIIGSIYTEATWPTFDILTLIYGLFNVVLLILTLYALAGTLKSIDIAGIKERFTKRPPRELTALFFLLAALVVSANFWMEFTYLHSSYKLDCVVCLTGTVFLFPFYLFFLYITVTVLLISNRPLGYVLAPGLLLFCGIGGFQILYNSLFYYQHLTTVLNDPRYSDVLADLFTYNKLISILPSIVAFALEFLFLNDLISKQELEKVD